jgi:hypothetical protein
VIVVDGGAAPPFRAAIVCTDRDAPYERESGRQNGTTALPPDVGSSRRSCTTAWSSSSPACSSRRGKQDGTGLHGPIWPIMLLARSSIIWHMLEQEAACTRCDGDLAPPEVTCGAVDKGKCPVFRSKRVRVTRVRTGRS